MTKSCNNHSKCGLQQHINNNTYWNGVVITTQNVVFNNNVNFNAIEVKL